MALKEKMHITTSRKNQHSVKNRLYKFYCGFVGYMWGMLNLQGRCGSRSVVRYLIKQLDPQEIEERKGYDPFDKEFMMYQTQG